MEWNLGDGLRNVCLNVMGKLQSAGYRLENQERTIINLDSYGVTALIWALDKYMKDKGIGKWN